MPHENQPESAPEAPRRRFKQHRQVLPLTLVALLAASCATPAAGVLPWQVLAPASPHVPAQASTAGPAPLSALAQAREQAPRLRVSGRARLGRTALAGATLRVIDLASGRAVGILNWQEELADGALREGEPRTDGDGHFAFEVPVFHDEQLFKLVLDSELGRLVAVFSPAVAVSSGGLESYQLPLARPVRQRRLNLNAAGTAAYKAFEGVLKLQLRRPQGSRLAGSREVLDAIDHLVMARAPLAAERGGALLAAAVNREGEIARRDDFRAGVSQLGLFDALSHAVRLDLLALRPVTPEARPDLDPLTEEDFPLSPLSLAGGGFAFDGPTGPVAMPGWALGSADSVTHSSGAGRRIPDARAPEAPTVSVAPLTATPSATPTLVPTPSPTSTPSPTPTPTPTPRPTPHLKTLHSRFDGRYTALAVTHDGGLAVGDMNGGFYLVSQPATAFTRGPLLAPPGSAGFPHGLTSVPGSAVLYYGDRSGLWRFTPSAPLAGNFDLIEAGESLGHLATGGREATSGGKLYWLKALNSHTHVLRWFSLADPAVASGTIQFAGGPHLSHSPCAVAVDDSAAGATPTLYLGDYSGQVWRLQDGGAAPELLTTGFLPNHGGLAIDRAHQRLYVPCYTNPPLRLRLEAIELGHSPPLVSTVLPHFLAGAPLTWDTGEPGQAGMVGGLALTPDARRLYFSEWVNPAYGDSSIRMLDGL
ncbi:MAG: hypothetical protein VKP62_06035 [Candidatus Sericytochromatia bacterium]|nr:hypothetical protein [Candidatus Sericytochromatia bacterium]